MKIFADILQHPFIAGFIALLAAVLAAFAFTEGRICQMSAYLAAVLAAVLVTDFLASKFVAGGEPFKIKSLKKELALILTVQLVILILSVVRFQVFTDWQNTGMAIKLPVLLLMILFVYPAVLIAAMMRWRYSLKEIGFVLKNFRPALPVILIIGAAAYFFAPEKMKFAAIYREMGLIPMILTGFLVAAIPEELTRFLLQTRLGKFVGNNAFGWVAASLVWAFLHLPNFYAQGRNTDLTAALWQILAITPIGLLWGYMTHRTRSILPATAVHGTNLWGLQNF